MPETPLTAEQVEERLDQFLEPVLSSRRTAAAPARGLTGFDRARQEFVLRWVGIIASSNAEMAFQVASHAAQALKVMDEKAMEGWIIHAMDVYDKAGLHSAVAALKEIESYARELRARASGLVFEEVSRVLEAFVRGLSGRPLKLEAAEQIYTDTETLFLPAIVSRFPRREDNFRLYKAVTVHLWAQTWFGTWRMSLAQAAAGFGDAARAVRAFHALEILRLDACIARELPGVHRDMNALRAALGEEAPPSSPVWYQAAEILSRPGAGVEESYRWLPRVYAEELPRPLSYQGGLYPERVEQQMALRREREKQAFRVALAKLLDERRAPREPSPIADERDKAPRRFELHEQRQEDAEQPDGFIYELWLDGQPVVPPEDVKGLMESIIQDLGEIPDDYLVPAGDGAYHAVEHAQRDPKDVWKGMYHEEGAFLYNEWDYERRHYRKNWCVLREIDVHPRQDDFPARTLIKYSGLVKVLRRTFEALRGEDKTLKKQPYGDDVDIDALVEAYADVASGREMSERLFTKLHKLERNIAVMFMVDMSGSTKGWINDAEREALILLCEALEALGDRYAIYGFSGMTRKRCELFRIKRFSESYDDLVRSRISGIAPQDYTRMGVVIRHLSKVLNEVDARIKLLITLSDGKPDDLDGYRGTYGIEDTRQALIEAKQAGIHPFCITIDTEARDYLPHMYGAVNFTVIDQVAKLPLKVSDIYRRLTT